MKVAYVTDYDATDVSMWSGTAYYIAQSLQQQSLELDFIGPLEDRWLSKVVRKAKRHYHEASGKTYLRDPEPLILKNYADQISCKLSKKEYDVVLSATVNPVAYLSANQPVAFWADATFSNVLDFYPHFTNLCQETIDAGHQMERLALQNSQLAIYSSDWAAQTAINYYGADPAKVKVVPFGANISEQRTLTEIQTLIQQRPTQQCNLLFMGVDWDRKGGNIAFEIARSLNESGLPTQLTVIGCQPNIDEPIPEFVRALGFISKATQAGKDKITAEISNAHFLVLPSLADCTPIVFSEANSLGVPCLTTNVGGIPTIIHKDRNGATFDLADKIPDWCNYVMNTFSGDSTYSKLAVTSFEEYKTRLNWQVAGRRVKQLLAEL